MVTKQTTHPIIISLGPIPLCWSTVVLNNYLTVFISITDISISITNMPTQFFVSKINNIVSPNLNNNLIAPCHPW